MTKGNFIIRIFLSILLIIPVAASAQSISGTWQSEFTISDEHFRLQLNLREPDLTTSSYTEFVEGGLMTVPFEHIDKAGSAITFTIQGYDSIEFSGELHGDKIEGQITTLGESQDVTFTRTGDVKTNEEVMSAFQDGVPQENPGDLNNDLGQPDVNAAPQKFNYSLFIYFALFWVVVSILLWFIFRKRKNMPGTDADEPLPVNKEDEEKISRLMPLIRLGREVIKREASSFKKVPAGP